MQTFCLVKLVRNAFLAHSSVYSRTIPPLYSKDDIDQQVGDTLVAIESMMIHDNIPMV